MGDSWTPRTANGTSRGFGFAVAAILLASLLAAGCHHAAPPKANKVVEVVVTRPIFDEVTDYEDFTGRIDALKTVEIRPRVSGYITEAPFVEGDLVKEGDLLFQIDPRPYEAELNQAEANLRQAEAEVALQTKRAVRGQQLMRGGSGAISPEDYDQLAAARDKAIAAVGAMKAARDRAKLNLEFTHVVVPPLRDEKNQPLAGRISRRLVDPGNLVNADQTILTTLVSIDPVYAYFDVDERTYLKLAELTASGSNSWFSALQFPVLMKLANQEEFQQKGNVNFLDNRLNANTGTVRMRGIFTNPSGLLKSGLFVRIRLPIGVPYKTLMIPDEAPMSDQGRKFVYVVEKAKIDKDGEQIEVDQVKYRAVELGQSIKGLRVIKDDKLKEGERVIISGMQRVRPDSVVKVVEQAPPPPPKSSLTRILKDNAPANESPKPSAATPNLKDMPRIQSGQAQHRDGKGRH